MVILTILLILSLVGSAGAQDSRGDAIAQLAQAQGVTLVEAEELYDRGLILEVLGNFQKSLLSLDMPVLLGQDLVGVVPNLPTKYPGFEISNAPTEYSIEERASAYWKFAGGPRDILESSGWIELSDPEAISLSGTVAEVDIGFRFRSLGGTNGAILSATSEQSYVLQLERIGREWKITHIIDFFDEINHVTLRAFRFTPWATPYGDFFLVAGGGGEGVEDGLSALDVQFEMGKYSDLTVDWNEDLLVSDGKRLIRIEALGRKISIVPHLEDHWVSDLGIDSTGTVYFLDRQRAQIVSLDLNNGMPLVLLGPSEMRERMDAISQEDIEEILPHSRMAVGYSGKVYIADPIRACVYALDRESSALEVIAGVPGTHGTPTLGNLAIDSYLDQPFGISVDRFENLYLTDLGTRQAYLINGQSGVISAFDGPDAQSLEFDTPEDIIRGSYTRWYVASTGQSSIYRRAGAGNSFAMEFGNGRPLFGTDPGVPSVALIDGDPVTLWSEAYFDLPNRLTTDRQGGPSILDSGSNRIYKDGGWVREGYEISTPDLDFGAVPIGDSRTLPLILHNRHVVPYPTSIRLSAGWTSLGSGATSEDSIFSISEYQFDIRPESSDTIWVTFTPRSVGPVANSLRSRVNFKGEGVAQSIALSLNGEGPATSKIVLERNSLSSVKVMSQNLDGVKTVEIRIRCVPDIIEIQDILAPPSGWVLEGFDFSSAEPWFRVSRSSFSNGSELGELRIESKLGFKGDAILRIASVALVLADGSVRTIFPSTEMLIEVDTRLSSDFSEDGKVDFSDFILFAQAYGKQAVGGNARFDLEPDGIVNFADFMAFAIVYQGRERSGS